MKLLLIQSSGRTHGNTARVMDAYAHALQALANESAIELELDRIDLARLSILPCIGCRTCFDRGEDSCPHQDDVLSLYARMRLADGYLIASPIYVEDINGTLKTMIDRMAFLCHRPALFGKSAFLFTTNGIGSSRHALATMSKAFGTWGIKTAGQAQFRLGALSTRDEIAARYGKAIERDARRFFRQLLRQPFRPSMYSLIAFTVQQSLWSKSSVDHDTVDYRYWRDSGWLERGRRYYVPALARSPKAILARGLGKIIALFFQ